MRRNPLDWTKEEDQYLKENHKIKTYKKMSEEINRNTGSINGRLHRLNLKKRKNAIQPDIKKIPEWLKGYLAGIIDGEGSVGIHREFVNNNGKRYGPMYRPCIEIAMCYKVTDTTKELQNMLNDAGFSISYRRRSNENNRLMGACYTHTTETIRVLANMLKQYAITKKRHLELIEEFCESRKKNFMKKYTEREKQIYFELRKLNYRGGKVHNIISEEGDLYKSSDTRGR